MLIKFESGRDSLNTSRVVECRAYTVKASYAEKRVLVTCLDGQELEFRLKLHEADCWATAYVTNESGKTVDTIRAPQVGR